MAIITLTTDFGTDSPYVAAMKGVVLSIQQDAVRKPSHPALAPPVGREVGREAASDLLIVDITHAVPPQEIGAAALILADTSRWFPPGTIHVVVVDPGVGTDRRVLCIDAGGHLLIGPDNGVLAPAVRDAASVHAYEISEPRFRLPEVSSTFHGRDIMAPAAAFLSLGVTPGELGPPVKDWVRFELPPPVVQPGRVDGQVLYVDSFGNLITNVTPDDLVAVFDSLTEATRSATVICGPHKIRGLVGTYAEAGDRATAALIGSSNRLEIAVVNGNAARELALDRGAPVAVTFTV
jgi:S-adenosylmethionine hydrolase